MKSPSKEEKEVGIANLKKCTMDRALELKRGNTPFVH